MKQKAVIGNDHGAVEVKRILMDHLISRGYEVNNFGVDEETSVDYPDIVRSVCEEFLKGGYAFGVLCCGTGIGVTMAANKIQGIRCALPQNSFAAQMAKQHNNAQFIAFGGRVSYPEPITDMLDAFISTEFEGGRHAQRVNKIMDLSC